MHTARTGCLGLLGQQVLQHLDGRELLLSRPIERRRELLGRGGQTEIGQMLPEPLVRGVDPEKGRLPEETSARSPRVRSVRRSPEETSFLGPRPRRPHGRWCGAGEPSCGGQES